MAYVIKRYPNRKLYDVQESRYVTLEDLAAMIRGGKEISVLDASTGEDLTAVVLTQIILEHERGGQAALPAAFLHQLIKHGEAWQQIMARGLYATLEGVIATQRDAERVFRTWATRMGLLPSQEEAAPATPAGSASGEAEGLRQEIAALKRKVRDPERTRKRRAKGKSKR